MRQKMISIVQSDCIIIHINLIFWLFKNGIWFYQTLHLQSTAYRHIPGL